MLIEISVTNMYIAYYQCPTKDIQKARIKKYHKMMLAAILILTAGIFCYQVPYGDTGNCANQNQPNLVGCPLDYVKSVGGFSPLIGKWTYVNNTTSTLGAKPLGMLWAS